MIRLSSKSFVLAFIGFTCLFLVLLYGLHYVNRKYYDLNNYQLLSHQLEKLESTTGVETVIVGDSSLGNAIDVELFSQLSSQKTLSLPMMGTTGFEGIFNMIREAKQTQRPKNVVIMSTFQLWDKPFSKEAYFETLGSLPDPDSTYDIFPSRWGEDYMRFLFNIYDVPLYFSYSRDTEFLKRRRIDPTTDYVVQGVDKFSNGGKQLTEADCLTETVHEERKHLFEVLDQLCAAEDLNCIYVHGPLHKDVATCSMPQMNIIHEVVRNGQRIIPVEKTFLYPSEKMGDAVDHIDSRFREEVTREYFEAIQPFLK